VDKRSNTLELSRSVLLKTGRVAVPVISLGCNSQLPRENPKKESGTASSPASRPTASENIDGLDPRTALNSVPEPWLRRGVLPNTADGQIRRPSRILRIRPRLTQLVLVPSANGKKCMAARVSD
jgi:hypothetical protein